MLILYTLSIFVSFTFAFPSTSKRSLEFSRRQDVPVSRQAWILVYWVPEAIKPSVPTYTGPDPYFNVHSALQIAPDDNNGGARIQIKWYFDENQIRRYTVEMTDLGRDAPAPGAITMAQDPSKAYFRDAIPIVEPVTVSNAELMDPWTGKGIIADLWGSNVDYNILTNNCNDLVLKLMSKLQLTVPQYDGIPGKDLPTHFAEQVSFYRDVCGFDTTYKDTPVSYKSDYDAYRQLWEMNIEFDVRDPASPTIIRDGSSPPPPHPNPNIPPETRGVVINHRVPQPLDAWYSQPDAIFTEPQDAMPAPNAFNQAAESSTNSFDIKYDDVNSFEFDSCSTKKRSKIFQRQACGIDKAKYDALREAGSKELVLTRTKGTFNAVSVFDSPVVKTLGVAAAVAAIAFVILDFVQGDFKAAAWGIGGILIGVAAAITIAGPIGELVGAVLGVLFAILPGLIGEVKTPPPANNITQIIQFAFFGDKDHTGNEKCNEQRVAAQLEPNCTVVYGAGVLSKVFKWEPFDAVSFLIKYNLGQAMSIPDMANAFHVIDLSKGNDGGYTASINCDKFIVPFARERGQPLGLQPLPPSAGYPCKNAVFALKRQQITIPVINQTADKIYDRIIPAPNGDCKIVSDPSGGFNYGSFNLTVRGRPAGIACGLNATTNVPGSLSAPFAQTWNVSSGTNSSMGINGTNSTNASYPYPVLNVTSSDGIYSRIFEYAPPPVPFAPLTALNSVCLTTPTGQLCLPPGRYYLQTAKFTSFSTTGINALTMPAGGKFNFTSRTAVVPTVPIRFDHSTTGGNSIVPISYSGNTTSSQLTDSFSRVEPAYFDISLSADPPCVCIFSEVRYQGDVRCYGVGGGDIPDVKAVRAAKSIAVHGEASVWIYAQAYNDYGGALLTTNVEDLTEIPYGNTKTNGVSDNFSAKIVAIWVKPPASKIVLLKRAAYKLLQAVKNLIVRRVTGAECCQTRKQRIYRRAGSIILPK